MFFSRVTLENALGSAYEPTIFAALQSARVMVVIGTKPEYFNATWVKNEWGRYLALIREGADKTLVPVFRNMSGYDLPPEFAHLQAQDMGKLGAMQDLVRGIRKLVPREAPASAAAPVHTAEIAPMLGGHICAWAMRITIRRRKFWMTCSIGIPKTYGRMWAF